ncbi:unnamed protein product [Lepeophtheirus salmonis]|nr:unnamed protein product [Lepeophtheirus salmonis]CAF3033606.1 unnamed protein product [Lepeophtheirus salmonis]
MDGCSINNIILKGLIKHSNIRGKPISLAWLDMRKAFDSVSHESMIRALKMHKIPSPIINYIYMVYMNASTSLEGRLPTKLKRGILQGDPMSGTLFTLVMESVFHDIKCEAPYIIENSVAIDRMMYADDTILISESISGLQSYLTQFEEAALKVGLELNSKKSGLLSTVKASTLWTGSKGTAVNETHNLNTMSGKINNMKLKDFYKYLGVRYASYGQQRVGLISDLNLRLKRLDEAYISHKQRYHILKTNVLPRYLYSLTKTKIAIGECKDFQIAIRKYVRKITGLFHDAPISFIEAKLSYGGLGIMNILSTTSFAYNARMESLLKSGNKYIRSLRGELPSTFFELIPVKFNRVVVHSKTKFQELVRDYLISRVDTKGMKYAMQGAGNYNFLRDNNFSMSNTEFKRVLQIMGGNVATKSKYNRYKSMATTNRCENCTDKIKNLDHILQTCPRAHGARIERHEKMVNYIDTKLNKPDVKVFKNQVYIVGKTTLKPDLVILKDNKINIFDPTIIGATSDLVSAHSQKRLKYMDPLLLKAIQEKHSLENIPLGEVGGIVINWNGILLAKSKELLKTLGMSKRYIDILVVRCLSDSYKVWALERQRPDRLDRF